MSRPTFDRYVVRRLGVVPASLRVAGFTTEGKREAEGAAADLNAGRLDPSRLLWGRGREPTGDEWCVVDTELTRAP